MILQIIASLGLIINFTMAPNIDCGYYGQKINGCYYQETKEIYVSYKSSDINQTMYHEIGHAIFWRTKYRKTAKDLVENLPVLRNVQDYDIDESIADYFALYMMQNKEFSVKYPSLYIFFRDVVDGVVK